MPSAAHPSPGRRTGRRLALVAAAVLAAAGLGAWHATGASAASSATVTVNASQALGTIPGTGVGMNVAVYDGYMNDSPVSGLLKNAGIGAVRYPGGSYADIYHWQTNTADNGGYIAPNTGFDAYMTTVRAAGAQPVIIVNYGSGTPAEAAAWVQYANVTKGYGVKYWEIGNEIYGNGEYGSSWENDTHSSHSATTYATNLLQFISAMKAVDPTIKIGAVLTTPGSWPDGIVGTGDTADWNHTVLSMAGPKIDFGIVHFYPGGTSAADQLTKASTIPPMMSTLRGLYAQYGGSNAANIGTAVTETNSTVDKDTQPAALFAPDNYLTWLENGVFNVDWWNLHNGASGPITTVAGQTDYNDEGVLSNASSNGGATEPAAETPFPTYWGVAMVSKAGAPGDQLVSASSSQSLVAAHAVRKANGDLSVLLINKDPSNAYTVNLSYNGFTPSSAAPTVYSFTTGATSIGSATTGTATSQTIPAYSIETIVMHPGSGGSPSPTPSASRTASPSPSPSRTVSPSPSRTTSPSAGACSVAYRVGSDWGTGFTASIAITNTGSAAVNGWTLKFTFPGTSQQVQSGWNGTFAQSGQQVTVTNASYNAAIGAGGSVSLGFNGAYSGTNPVPTAFTLNGASCTVA